MTKTEAVFKCIDFVYKIDAKNDKDLMFKLIDFMVDELGMLPPLRDLECFPGHKDNGWEEE